MCRSPDLSKYEFRQDSKHYKPALPFCQNYIHCIIISTLRDTHCVTVSTQLFLGIAIFVWGGGAVQIVGVGILSHFGTELCICTNPFIHKWHLNGRIRALTAMHILTCQQDFDAEVFKPVLVTRFI